MIKISVWVIMPKQLLATCKTKKSIEKEKQERRKGAVTTRFLDNMG